MPSAWPSAFSDSTTLHIPLWISPAKSPLPHQQKQRRPSELSSRRILTPMRGAVPLIALLASGCAPEPAPFTPSPPVSLTTPFLLELNAAPGVGTAGGRAVVTARVLNANYAPLPNTDVQFTTAAGTFSGARVATDAEGRASTTLTAPPGSVQVTARAASLEERVLVSVQPATQPVPPPPNQPEPSPPEPDFALGIDFVTPVVYLPTRF